MAIVQHSKDAKLISVIARQVSKEYSEIAGLLIEYMTLNKLSGLRVSQVNELLLKVAESVPGFDKMYSMVGNPTGTLYKMFRELLVARSFDIDPAGSGDSSRDEHIVYNMVGIPELRSVYDMVYPRYQIKTPDQFYAEQGALLYDIVDELTGKAEERKIEVVQAMKSQGVSVARSKPLPEVVVKLESNIEPATVQETTPQATLSVQTEVVEASQVADTKIVEIAESAASEKKSTQNPTVTNVSVVKGGPRKGIVS